MADNLEDRDSVGALILAVGRRSVPPREDYERVLSASRAAWQGAVRQRVRRRWTYALAAVVAFVVFGAGVLRQIDGPHPAVVAATLTTIDGAVFAGSAAGEEWRWLSESGVPLTSGTRLRTDPSGRAALRLRPDTSLRMAGSTDLLLQPGNRVELLEGRIYLDTSSTHSGTVEIVTRFGTLRDVGTQFEVLATGTTLRVRTREGAVTLTRGGSEAVLQCAVSEELRIDSSGNIERGRIASYDAEWSWAESLTEPPKGPELPLRQFLDWVARETGRSLRYDSPVTEARVNKVVLHGTTPDLAPVAALAVALATTDIEYTLRDDGTILLRYRQSP
jgi:ferric-dicitrate binding protein FerR (iron transport regulator)